jgi:hypothetical protein
MNIINIIPKLPPRTVKDVQNTLFDACFAYENGNEWRLIFTRAKHNSAGFNKRFFELLEKANFQEIERLSQIMASASNDL